MSGLPRILAQIAFGGITILGRAFAEAGRQAARNARAGNIEAAAGGAAGATTGNNASDNLTRTHRMTLDEARMILNMEAKEVKENGEAAQEKLEKSYEHLFKANAPPAPKGAAGGGAGSFYMQSKVVRARERIEAEWKALLKQGEKPEADAAAAGEAKEGDKAP